MTVVGGDVPDSTGHLAVTEAARQAHWRETDLVIVNAVDATRCTRPTAADETDLDALEARFAEDGSPIGKALLGSNAQRILLGARWPVLAVRAPEHD